MQSPMPKTVRASLWLLIGSFLATPVVGVINPTPFPGLPDGSVPFVVVFVLFLGLMVLVAVMAYRQRNWARWVHSVMFVFGPIVSVPVQMEMFSTSPATSLLGLMLYAAQLASVALLFAPQSNAWYSASVPRAA
jgi:hypothetical protein